MENFLLDRFIEKHGNNVFSDIKKCMKEELLKNDLIDLWCDDYAHFLFDFTFYNHCGIEPNKVPIMINGLGNKYLPDIPMEKIKQIHKKSMKKIIDYFNINKTKNNE